MKSKLGAGLAIAFVSVLFVGTASADGTGLGVSLGLGGTCEAGTWPPSPMGFGASPPITF